MFWRPSSTFSTLLRVYSFMNNLVSNRSMRYFWAPSVAIVFDTRAQLTLSSSFALFLKLSRNVSLNLGTPFSERLNSIGVSQGAVFFPYLAKACSFWGFSGLLPIVVRKTLYQELSVTLFLWTESLLFRIYREGLEHRRRRWVWQQECLFLNSHFSS